MKLGKLERVDLRDVWKHEALHFTPWLAKPDNLALLAETLGIDLELVGTERNVGPFSADILCRDTLGEHFVLVENQLERTDHTHLGQLLTYAAGLDAVSIVWIAARFEEPHRSALDWLNEHTSEHINFFGLEVEVWRIGDSPVAPKFNVVARPNDWTKEVMRRANQPGELSDTAALQLQFWTEFKRFVEAKDGPIRPRRPKPRSWANYAIGRTDFWLEAYLDSKASLAKVSLGMWGDMQPCFHLLKRDQEELETAIGQPVIWHEKSGVKYNYIGVQLEDVSLEEEGRWPEIMARIYDALCTLHRVFSGRIKTLDPSKFVPEESRD